MRFRVTVLAVLAAATATCSKPAPDAVKPAPAAKVQAPKPESDLTSITLTSESEKHLALKTATTAIESVSPARLVGGEATFPPGKSIVITAPTAGTIAAAGDRPPIFGAGGRNATILSLVPLQQNERDAQIEAERALNESQARLTEATQRLRRLEGLLKDGSASARSVEEARTTQAVADAAVTAAKQRVEAGRGLPTGPRGEIAIKAPFDGTITAMRVAPGQTVAAGAPVAEIAQVQTLWVRVPVYAGDLANIDTNAPASIASLGQESSGPWHQARRVSGPPAANPAAASVDLFYEMPKAGVSIRPGERVSVRLSVKSTQQALVIPQSAVVYDIHGGAWVYESKGQHVYVRRRVEVTGPGGAGLVIKRGLVPGIQIVTVGAAELFGTEFYVSK